MPMKKQNKTKQNKTKQTWLFQEPPNLALSGATKLVKATINAYYCFYEVF